MEFGNRSLHVCRFDLATHHLSECGEFWAHIRISGLHEWEAITSYTQSYRNLAWRLRTLDIISFATSQQHLTTKISFVWFVFLFRIPSLSFPSPAIPIDRPPRECDVKKSAEAGERARVGCGWREGGRDIYDVSVVCGGGGGGGSSAAAMAAAV